MSASKFQKFPLKAKAELYIYITPQRGHDTISKSVKGETQELNKISTPILNVKEYAHGNETDN